MGSYTAWLLAACLALGSWSCVPSHCQSGAKGTQCYDQLSPNDPPATADDEEKKKAPPRNPVAPTTPR